MMRIERSSGQKLMLLDGLEKNNEKSVIKIQQGEIMSLIGFIRSLEGGKLLGRI